ncbi:MAG: hypothetical protein A2V70_13950 [Planctomycetes bacterium RBG_13_63_9]|nr:MAG: hypothetical protein A2V70_13950 [Planctomycetes bacterium RBG_13_63_9]
MQKKRGWLSRLLRSRAARDRDRETQRLMNTSITNKDEAYAVACHLDVLEKVQEYEAMASLLDKLACAPEGLILDRHELRAMRVRVLCKVGRFEEAERESHALIEVLQRFPGGTTVANNSNTMFWHLVARHRGDTKRAMSEFAKLR